MSTAYRPEIDGLRAVAVLPVILYHAGAPIFSGGFVGVDVFFVISGYLITGLLLSDLTRGQFSIVDFYIRRARRILPALFLVTLCCIPFAWMWMLPMQFDSFGKSLVAVVAFASNILFWLESGYFEASAELKPLLHTWSLAVEEQFYIFFPLMLAGLFALARRRHPGRGSGHGRSWAFALVATLSLCSLVASHYGARHFPSANFYLIPMRAWELGAGALCAFLSFDRERQGNPWLAAAGLIMIVVAILTFNETTPFPSLWALLPVAGAAIVVLFAAPETGVGRFLAWRGCVGVGLISYSAYLWHQPVLAFLRLRSTTEPALPWMILAALMALPLAWLSWKYVERPFRRPAPGSGLRHMGAAALTAACIGSLGLYAYLSDGAPARLNFSERIIADMTESAFRKDCFNIRAAATTPASEWFCEKGDPDSDTLIGVWGDSHALPYLGPLHTAASEVGLGLRFSGIAGCPPLRDTRVAIPGPRGAACNARNQAAFSDAALDDVDVAILIGRWMLYTERGPDSPMVNLGTGRPISTDAAETRATFFRQLAETLALFEAHGIPVILVHQPPVQPLDAPLVYANAFQRSMPPADVIEDASISADQFSASYGPLQDRLEVTLSAAAPTQGQSVDPSGVLCDGVCLIGDNNRARYQDNDHLSNFGASLVVPDMFAQIRHTMTGSVTDLP